MKLAKSLARAATSKKHLVSAKAVVVLGDKVLLLRQSNGHWDLPGGKLDRGETVTQGLAREVWEETRLKIGPRAFLTSESRKRQAGKGVLTMSFLCTPEKKGLGRKHVRLSGEHRDFALVEIQKAKRLKLRKRHLQAIAAAEKRIRKTGLSAN